MEDFWVDRSAYDYSGVMYRCGRDTCKGGDVSAHLIATTTVFNHGDEMSAVTSSEKKKKKSEALSQCWVYGHYNKSECKDKDDLLMCGEGANGPLCGSCKKSYTFNSVLNACEKCGGELSALFYAVLGSFLFVILLVWFVDFYFKLSIRSNFMVHILSNMDSGSLKVIWVTYQIIISSSFTLNMKVC
jgi:uncharacterized protein (DUF983 family)